MLFIFFLFLSSKRELNLLAELITSGAGPLESFKLNLFPDTSFSGSGGGTPYTYIYRSTPHLCAKRE